MFGNPHSANPSSLRTEGRVEALRARLLHFLGADPEVYDVRAVGEPPGRPQLLISWPCSRSCLANPLRAACHARSAGRRAIRHAEKLRPALAATDGCVCRLQWSGVRPAGDARPAGLPQSPWPHKPRASSPPTRPNPAFSLLCWGRWCGPARAAAPCGS